MLFKSMKVLKSNATGYQAVATYMMGGVRAAGFSSKNMSGNFSFPKHKEFFNDEYYGEEGPTKSPFASKAAGPKTMSEDYIDPNNPFVSENLSAPGGILASYKKRVGLSAQEVMEQSYWDKIRNFRDETSDYFDVVGKSERDMMANTKNFTNRLRLDRQIEFNDDFRKRFMTSDYGNYKKYEENNSVGIETEKGENDFGFDKLMKNDREMNMRLNTEEGEEQREKDKSAIENLLQNETYADQTMKERFDARKAMDDHPDELHQKEHELKFLKNLENQEILYNGRMSYQGKEELYLNYQKGMSIKDLSLKYGILPQRVKAIIFQKHLYWNEVYPRMGETHQRLSIERELLYASDFPFIDYGADLKIMSEIEKGIKMHKIRRSDIDANPPEAVKKRIEESLSKMKPKKQDYIPEGFVGKGGRGYILKNWVIHRGYGAPIVNKKFRDAVRLAGSKNEHLLSNNLKLRMRAGGPRYAAMAERK
jgi:hypothetical protein